MEPWSCWCTGNNEHADSLTSLNLPAQCPLQWFLVLSPLPLLKRITPSTTNGNVTFPSHFHHNCQISAGSHVEMVLPRSLCCELSCFCCHGYSLLLLSYLTYAKSVTKTLPAAVVDNLYRISIIFFLTVLPQNLHLNLSLALVYTFCFRSCGPDLEVWPDCWNSAKFLRSSNSPSLKKESIAPPSSTTHTLEPLG